MAKQPKFKDTLPGELNENFGSNYMMDGFWYDMDYEHGLKENPPANPVPQPPTTGMSQLPEDVIATVGLEDLEVPEGVEMEGGLDLGELDIVATVQPDVDRTDVGIVDFSWLSDAYQDPNRLPDKPVDNGIPELQEAWGDRSDGLRRIDLRDRASVTYEDARQGPEDDDPLHTDKLAALIQSAMRRSAAGVPMAKIKQELLDALGPKKASRLAKPVQAIEAEHGLTGHVYVRASAYPGLHRGKWAKQLKAAAKRARYLIAAAGDDCAKGAGILGLRLIEHPTHIDWNDAYDYYTPMLEASGRLDRTATVRDKRLSLKHAFLKEEQTVRLDIETTKVRQTMPVDLVTAEQAKKAFIAFKPKQQQVIILVKRWKQAEVAKVVDKVGHMVDARLLSQEEAEKLLGSKAPPHQILRTAALLAINVKRGQYSGGEPVLSEVKITTEEAWGELRQAETKVAEAEAQMQERVQKDSIQQKVAFIVRNIQGGLKGKKLAAFIRETLSKEEAVLASPLLTPILQKTSALNPQAPEAKKYEGKQYTRHIQANVQMDVSDREIDKAVRWVRQAMNEAFAGPILDDLVRIRLGSDVRTASEDKLTQIRKKHEGLSGHLYIDAEAYAKNGTAGCEDGGLKHRANGVKYLLAMEACTSCVFKNADEVCQKYNKTVMDEVPENVEAYRRKILATHEMSDHELTASLFVQPNMQEVVVPKDEYSLHNSNLDNVDSEDPKAEMLDELFFGGFEI